MKKYIATALFINVCFSLLTVSAQITGDQAPTQADRQCTDLAYNLTYRKSKDSNTNGEVSDLQSFLQDQRLLNSDPTGNFGALTLRAVKTFQSKNGLLSSGYVGVYTRAMIKEVSCAFSTNQPATASGFFATTKIVSVKLEDTKVVFSGINLMALLKEHPDLYLGYKADCAFKSVCSGELEQASSDYYSTSFYINKDFKDLNSNGNIDVQIFDKKTGKSLSEVFSITSKSSTLSPVSNTKSSTLLPSVVLNMSPTTPEYGKSSTIFWTSTESTSCSYVGGEMNAVKGNSYGTSGSFSTQELTENKKYTVTCYGKGGYTTASLEIKVQASNQSTLATITGFSNKDPNPITGATAIIWHTSKAANTLSNGAIPISLDVSCSPGSISFVTDKGNAPDCLKGGIWNWTNTSGDSIVVTPVGNVTPVTALFTLTVQDPSGEYSKRQTQRLSITFPPTKKETSTNTSLIPTVEFLSAPTLKLQYDSQNKESALVGQVKVKVTTGSSAILIPSTFRNSTPRVVWITNSNANGSNVVYVNSYTTTSSNSGEVTTGQDGSISIPASTSVSFTLTHTVKTSQLLAGTYSFSSPDDLPYVDQYGASKTLSKTSFKNNFLSNTITIIGETSPYITGSHQSQKNAEQYYLFGDRFSSTANIITINGVTKTFPLDVSGGILFSAKDFNITSTGDYAVTVSVNGQVSNHMMVSMTVPVMSANISPIVEFLSAPTLKLQYDSANKEVLLVGQSIVKITTGASSLSLPTDNNGNPAVFIYSLLKSGGFFGGDSFVNLNSGKFVTTSSPNSSATIPPNTSVVLTTTYTAKPVDMFAGSYKLTPTGLYYIDQNGNGQIALKTSFKNASESNFVTVIGESVYQQMPQGNEGWYDGGSGGESGGSGASLILKSSLSQVKSMFDQGKAIASTFSGVTRAQAMSCTDIKTNLHRGFETSQVSKLQEFLIEKGFLSEKATGFFGDLTIKAVKAYQQSLGLKETGMVYDLTRQAIKTETCQ